MFTHHWKLAIVLIMGLPAYVLLYALANHLNRRVERELMERAAEFESQLVESLSATYTIKSFSMANYADRKTESLFVPVLQALYSSGQNGIAIGQAGEFLSRLFTIALLWIGTGFALDQAITPGELLSFYALMAYFSGPATSLISMNKLVQNALIASDRLFDIMDIETEETGENTVIVNPDQIGDIVFRDVQFRYDACVPVFDHLDLVINRHCVTAIVGESGCGKSTLISILQRIYPIQSGSVLIGSFDLRYLDLESLRKVVSVVPQRIDIFAGTILENIALGMPDPDLARVINICSSLDILEFIQRLPQGLHTRVGEHGASLSGGQKQRIAIARALYREPEIMALDEATSALDAHAEQYVHRMIDLMRERRKTVIIVAHRLSTIMRADKIVVLANGRVAEEGTHETLMASEGAYFRLWRQQFPIKATQGLRNGVLSLRQPVDEEINTDTEA
jgi:ATP-binding cassette, subfamily C, bacteriocin exporter